MRGGKFTHKLEENKQYSHKSKQWRKYSSDRYRRQMAWTKINRFGLIIFLSKTHQVNQFDMQMEKVCSQRISNLKANKTELAKMLADINPIKVA
jgi:hypothetical protein